MEETEVIFKKLITYSQYNIYQFSVKYSVIGCLKKCASTGKMCYHAKCINLLKNLLKVRKNRPSSSGRVFKAPKKLSEVNKIVKAKHRNS